MTPELKENLYKFLWDESMLYDEQEMNLISKWIDENILNVPLTYEGNNPVIDNHIKSLELQNRGYRSQLEKEILPSLIKGMEESIRDNEIIINTLQNAAELKTENIHLLKTNEFVNKENKQISDALSKSVEVIKEWHNMGASRFKSREVIEEIWHIYYKNAPEMKLIREALKGEV